MKTDHSTVVGLWTKEYSGQLKKYVAYKATEQLQRLGSIFSPGLSYYYIMNLQNLHLEYISPEVEELTGIPPAEATVPKLLSGTLSEEFDMLIKKEKVIKDFFDNFITREDLLHYKLIYTYRFQDKRGNLRHMMHQASLLSLSDDGKPQHVISIHSDVSHLKIPKNDKISFISLNGKKSFYNLNAEDGVFRPDEDELKKTLLASLLTARERQILSLLAKGYNAKKIAELLHLSFNTIRTHRKNMLQKTGCTNTAGLVARWLMEGVPV